MNNRIRQQLRDLRIDPDATFGVVTDADAVRAPRWRWRRSVNWPKLMFVVASAGVFSGLLILAVFLIAASRGSNTQPDASAKSSVSHMQFAGLQLDIVEPEYRSIATDGTTPTVQWVAMTMNVANVSDRVVAIEAGELNLVDSRGALYAPLWRDPGGALSDGFAAPEHTMFALTPGGTTELTLVFVIRGPGQYALRYLGPDPEPVSEVALAIR